MSGPLPVKGVHNYAFDIALSNEDDERKWIVLSFDEDEGLLNRCLGELQIDGAVFKENDAAGFLQITCSFYSATAFLMKGRSSLDIANFQPFLLSLEKAGKLFVTEASEMTIEGSPIAGFNASGSAVITDGGAYRVFPLSKTSGGSALKFKIMKKWAIDI
ncbi:MAG: hypothetical protein FJ088_04700 [Deltaproteobacteria bacterium]|nr:hypothetical protein [Deltaproteobacteria bacterium]